MRTKTLLAVAATIAIGIASSMAQSNVYSLNIVGYVNTPVPASSTFTIVENPLDASGTTSSNTIGNLLPKITGLVVFRMVGGAYAEYDYLAGPPGQNWYSLNDDDYVDNTLLLSPGEGFWVKQPGTATNITFVGQVQTGTNTTTIIPGFGLYGSHTPIGTNATGINLTAALAANDYVLKFAGTFHEFDYQGGGVWYSLDDDDFIQPQFNVGEGFFINNLGSTKTWTNVFNP